jgi:glycosidase
MKFQLAVNTLMGFLILSVSGLLNAQNSTTDMRYQPKSYVQLKHPEWSRNATICEVNVRQYTPEGTFDAFAKHLPRIKEMGIDIIWLMPINPIGIKNRKGSLGSYYSVKDYYAVNPEFGNMEDLKILVKKIHESGMHVIIDWVANHCSWDNALAVQHPDWFSKNIDGKFQPTPWYDWDDVIDFDYDQPGLREYMTNVLKFWVKEADIDGYRCDVAGFIPTDFWENVRQELETIKPVFMLAEWESRELHAKAFDMTYSWSLWDIMYAVIKERKPIWKLNEYMAHHVNTFPAEGYRMTFVDNHDKNSWEGNPFSNFGDGLEAAMVMTCTVSGMPLIYSGQEAGLDRSLKFFDKDSIAWKAHSNGELYKKLFGLKHTNEALWNGASGGEMIRVYNDQPEKVISFYREKNGDKVLTVINFSPDPLIVKLETKYFKGTYAELFTEKKFRISGEDMINLKGWGCMVLHSEK